MSGLWDRLTGQVDRRSAKMAKERLIVVLSHDRSDIEPGVLEQIKDEISKEIWFQLYDWFDFEQQVEE